jgi:putative spermidine/putrescine transport system substrate-binding protein
MTHHRSEHQAQGAIRRPTRRAALIASLGGIAAPYLGLGTARAQGRELVIPMSGGSFMTNFGSEIIEPFRRQTGINVRMVPGNMKAHAMSLLASRANPPFDVFLGNGDDFVQIVDAGLALPLTPDKVPSIEEVHVKFREQWNGFGSMFDYFSIGLSHATREVRNPPRSWREFIDRTARGEFGNQVFFNSLAAGVRGPEVLVTLAKALSGDERNVDVAFDAIKRIRPHVFKFFTSINEPVVFLLNGEGVIGPGWDGRVFVAHDETNGQVDFVKPTDGLASNGPAIGVVKGGAEEAAYRFVNHALSVGPQQTFCEKMFYGAVNTRVTYSPNLASRIPRPEEITVPNERFMASNIGAWIERWNREIAL